MKKYLALFASVGSLMISSCSSDEPAVVNTDDGNVSFEVSLPAGIQSRSFSDGLTATDVKCFVYDQSNDAAPVITETIDMNGTLKGKLTLNLVTGRTYDIVFLATAAENSGITYDEAERSFSVAYGASNNENLDAFYWTEKNFTVTGPTNKSVKLYRPFAQLNIGTDDITAYNNSLGEGVELATVGVTVSNIYSTFDLMEETVSGTAADVTFTATATPDGEVFPVNGYEYLAMNYLLVPSSKDIVDVTMTVNNSDNTTDTRDYYNIPVQRNYRTNIYGSLLTTPSEWNVEIIPDYETPDYNYEYPVQALLDLFEQGGELTLDQNVDLNGKTLRLTTDKNVTLNLNGFSLYSTNIVVSAGTLTINGEGEIHATEEKAVHTISAAGNGIINLNDGHYFASIDDEGYTNSTVFVQGNGIVNIAGGQYEAQIPYMGKWYVLNKSNSSNGKIVVTGGKFYNQDPAAGDDKDGGNFVADGFASVQKNEGDTPVFIVVPEELKDYTIVENAGEIENALSASGNAKIAIVEDIEVPNGISVNGVKTINLNNKTILSTNTAKWDCIVAENGATLTIEGEGTVSANGNAVIPVAAWTDSKIIINGGTFIGGIAKGNDKACECIYVNGGEIEINGGYFSTPYAREKSKIKNPMCPDYGWYYLINMYNTASGKVTVNGGTFENYNPAWGDDADTTPASFLGEGATVTETEVDGKHLFTVKK